MKTLIIDDEPSAIESLELIIKEYCPEIEIIGTANSILEGIKLINATKPELVFLDIEMPGGSGFDLLEALENKSFRLIFTTGHSGYAIKAIKFSALDYLLKPVDIDELIEAVEKAILVNQNEVNNNLLHNLNEEENGRIAIATGNDYHFVNINDLLYLKSDGQYTHLATIDNSTISSKHLKVYENMLDENDFFRINNQYLINLKKVEKYTSKEGGSVMLINSETISISRTKKKELKLRLGIG